MDSERISAAQVQDLQDKTIVPSLQTSGRWHSSDDVEHGILLINFSYIPFSILN